MKEGVEEQKEKVERYGEGKEIGIKEGNLRMEVTCGQRTRQETEYKDAYSEKCKVELLMGESYVYIHV